MVAPVRAVLVALALAPLVRAQAGPGLSPVKLALGDASLVQAAGSQHESEIARGASGYLVVWTDARNTLDDEFQAPPSPFDTEEQDVLAMRLDAEGVPLEPFPFAIDVAAGGQVNPQVAWNGTHHLVAWATQISTEFFYTYEVRAARVAEDGAILDDPPLVVASFTSSFAGDLAVASDGSGWVVAVGGLSGGGVKAFRVAADGTLLDPSAVVLAASPSLFGSFDLEFAAGVYLLAYTDLAGVRARRFDASLAPLGGEITVSATADDENAVDLASNGTSFLAAWEVSGGGALITGYVRAARLTTAGAVLDPAPGIELTGDILFFTPRHPAAAWDGARWIVVFDRHPESTGEIRTVRVADDGSVLDFGGVPLGAFGDEMELATAAGGGVQLLYVDTTASFGGDVASARVAPDLSAGPSHAVSTGLPRESEPDLAPAPYGYLAVLVSELSGEDRVLAQRLDPFGNPIDPAPLVVGSGEDLRKPSVAWNGAVHMVVWELVPDVVMGTRVDVDGRLLALPTVLMQGDEPDVAATGGLFGVVATWAPLDPHFQFPYARLFDGTGAPLGPQLQIGTYYARNAAVAGATGRFLAVWQRHVTHDTSASVVQGTFVGPAGTSGDFVLASSDEEPDVAAAGPHALVVWQAGFTDTRVEGRLVDASAGPTGGVILVSDAPSHQTDPAVAWTGAEYVVVWEDLRDQETFWDVREDVFAARVDAGGVVLDPTGFPVLATSEYDRTPAAASDGATTLLAGASFLPLAPFGAYRVGILHLGAWDALGSGLAGTHGVPVLDAAGALTVGSTATLRVSGGPAGAPGALVLGAGEISVPLLGATLHAAPDVVLAFALGAEGAFEVALPVSVSLAPGTTIVAQAGFLDAGAPEGVAFTNAVLQVAP